MSSGPACVIDAGVVVGWFVAEEHGGPRGSADALALLDAAASRSMTLHAPELLYAEATNVLWKLSRFRGYPAAAAARAATVIAAAPIQAAPLAPLLGGALAIAARFDVTVYDALYVSLAESLGLPLITTDRALARKLSPAFPWIEALGS